MEIYDRGWRLKALRKKRGLSQKAVADRLGVDRAAISAYERNIATPRIDVLENLALLYRTSVDYILGMEHRAALYIDDLSESQQETVRSIVETLRQGILERGILMGQDTPLWVPGLFLSRHHRSLGRFFRQQLSLQRPVGHSYRCPCRQPAGRVDQQQTLEGGHQGEDKGHPQNTQPTDEHRAEDGGNEGVPQPRRVPDITSMTILNNWKGSTQRIRVSASRAMPASEV